MKTKVIHYTRAWNATFETNLPDWIIRLMESNLQTTDNYML